MHPDQKAYFDDLDPVEVLHTHNLNFLDREIFLTSWVKYENDDENGIDYRNASQFIKNLSLLNNINQPILVRMYSIGGDWNYGMAIYDAIKTSQSPITILVYAHARSMTSLILQSAPLRILMPNTEIMLHHGTLEEDGEYQGVVSSVEMAKKESHIMLQIYAQRCINGDFFKKRKSNTPTSVISFIKKRIAKKTDWWLTADEAIYYGLADGIYGQKPFLSIEDLKK